MKYFFILFFFISLLSTFASEAKEVDPDIEILKKITNKKSITWFYYLIKDKEISDLKNQSFNYILLNELEIAYQRCIFQKASERECEEPHEYLKSNEYSVVRYRKLIEKIIQNSIDNNRRNGIVETDDSNFKIEYSFSYVNEMFIFDKFEISSSEVLKKYLSDFMKKDKQLEKAVSSLIKLQNFSPIVRDKNIKASKEFNYVRNTHSLVQDNGDATDSVRPKYYDFTYYNSKNRKLYPLKEINKEKKFLIEVIKNGSVSFQKLPIEIFRDRSLVSLQERSGIKNSMDKEIMVVTSEVRFFYFKDSMLYVLEFARDNKNEKNWGYRLFSKDLKSLYEWLKLPLPVLKLH